LVRAKKTRTGKKDQLLSYLHHARNPDEHGIGARHYSNGNQDLNDKVQNIEPPSTLTETQY